MTSPPDGMTIALTDGAFYAADPYPAFAWMREHAPAFYDEAAGVWGVTRHADVKAIGKDPDTYSNAGGIRPDNGPLPMMIDTDAPEHVRRRRLVGEGFTPRQLRAAMPGIAAVCDDLIDRVCERGSADFVRDLAAPLPMIVIGDMLGVAPEDRDDLLRWSDDMLASLGSPDPAAADRAMVAAAEYATYVTAVVEERRRTGRADDLIGVLAHAEVDGDRLDDESILYESLLILIGGDETTRHVLSGGFFELLCHPDQLAAVRDDRSLLPGAVEEMLRWVSPIKNMARTLTRDVELHGEGLRAGEKLLLLYPAANRDPDAFVDPDIFDVRRHPNDHVAFGFGAHFCLGNRLARLELATMVGRVLDRLGDLALADGLDDRNRPPSRAANFVSGYETMPVVFTPVKAGASRAAVGP